MYEKLFLSFKVHKVWKILIFKEELASEARKRENFERIAFLIVFVCATLNLGRKKSTGTEPISFEETWTRESSKCPNIPDFEPISSGIMKKHIEREKRNSGGIIMYFYLNKRHKTSKPTH